MVPAAQPPAAGAAFGGSGGVSGGNGEVASADVAAAQREVAALRRQLVSDGSGSEMRTIENADHLCQPQACAVARSRRVLRLGLCAGAMPQAVAEQGRKAAEAARQAAEEKHAEGEPLAGASRVLA